jgi:signal transduction histidine kinase
MLRSLNSRLLVSHVAVVLVCLALVGLGLLVFVRTSPLWTLGMVLRLDAVARATMPVIQRGGPAGSLPPEQLYAALDQAAEDQAAEDQEVRVLLLDGEGKVLFDSEGEWLARTFPEVPPAVPPRAPRTRGAFTDPGGGRWVYVAETLPGGGGRPQIVLFASPVVRHHLLLWFAENLVPPLAQAGMAALVLSVLLVWLVARSVARPLEQVAAAAGGIAQGDLSRRAPVFGPQEARDLAVSFNRMVDRVAAAQQSQRDLVANVSHELKTPLTSVQGFSQAILDGTAADAAAVRRSAAIISDEADRMSRMVEELLNLARFDAGQVQLAREPVDIGAILRQCVERLAPQAERASNQLHVSTQDDLWVTGDDDWLMQVFVNLVDNAIRHSSGARVQVEAQRVDGWVEVAVTDSGEGIPADELERIFERFYQADRSRSRKGGAGLGLSIAREVVERLGGEIAAESVVGLGTRFTVRLPARRA